MDRWNGKVAVVTGASSGIGAATAIALADYGLKVVGVARRVEQVEALKEHVKGEGEIIALKCDVGVEQDIIDTFEFVRNEFGTIHILVNNAGILRPGKLIDQDSGFLREVLNVNVMGLSLCTQAAIKLMIESGVDDGQIIHINSVCGHCVPVFGPEPIFAHYAASKHAVTALTETLRQELRFQERNIRVTSISPGFVTTEIIGAGTTVVTGTGLPEGDDNPLKDLPALEAQDIADAIVYVLSTPPRVQIHELTIKPVREGF